MERCRLSWTACAGGRCCDVGGLQQAETHQRMQVKCKLHVVVAAAFLHIHLSHITLEEKLQTTKSRVSFAQCFALSSRLLHYFVAPRRPCPRLPATNTPTPTSTSTSDPVACLTYHSSHTVILYTATRSRDQSLQTHYFHHVCRTLTHRIGFQAYVLPTPSGQTASLPFPG